MKTKTASTKKTSKSSQRVIIDYSNNPSLAGVFAFLESYYQGMSKAEITKMALIKLLRTNNLETRQMTDEEEAEYAKAMENREYVKIPDGMSVSEYIMSM